jgi:hypothetical protein
VLAVTLFACGHAVMLGNFSRVHWNFFGFVGIVAHDALLFKGWG